MYRSSRQHSTEVTATIRSKNDLNSTLRLPVSETTQASITQAREVAALSSSHCGHECDLCML